MKVAVYTIALNEAAHAERWANSAVDADYRIVVDTGSTDDTVERLTAAGVTVHRIAVRPWRFDVARNAALALIPADVDVCCTMDMDRFLKPGWRRELEAAWTPETTALFCTTAYRENIDDDTVTKSWMTKNFHSRDGYRFRRPVHEELAYFAGTEVSRSCDQLVMYEIRDLTKTTRQQYLPLMELAHREDPDDGQICFWLAREYMWNNRHDEGGQLLEHYLRLPTATWLEERSEAMIYLARMQPLRSMYWLDEARKEAPHRREVWLEIAERLHAQEDWLNLFWACANGIERTRRTGSYLDDPNAWGPRLFDLGARAAFQADSIERAVAWGGKAIELAPDDDQLKRNLDQFIARRAGVPG